MAFKKPVILMLVIITLILSNINAMPTNITIRENVDISYGFIIEKLEIHSSNSFQFIKFNITGIKDYIALSYIEVNDSVVSLGKISGNELLFELPTPEKAVKTVIVFDNVFDLRNNSLYIDVPLVLSPIGLLSNTTLIVFTPTRYFTVIENPINASVNGVFIKANLTEVESGKNTFMRLKFNPYAFSLFYVSRLNRTFLIESNNYIKIIDDFEITGLTYVKTKGIYLHYPKDIEILGVEGPLGPYVKDGASSSYSIEIKNDKKILNIKLRSPPQNYGDKEYFRVITVFKVNSSNMFSIPVFGYDFLIKNYSLVVKIKGEAQFKNVKIIQKQKEGVYTLYYLEARSPLYKDVTSYNIDIVPKVITGDIPPYIYSSLGIIFSILVIAALYFVYSKRGEKQIVKMKEEVIEKEEEDVYSKIYEYEKARVQILETLIDNWKSLEGKKISRQTYRQRHSRLLKKEKEYAVKANEIARKISDSSLRKELNIIDENILDFKRLYKMLEKTMTNFSKGIITKREYRRRIDDIMRDLEDRIEKLYETVESLQK